MTWETCKDIGTNHVNFSKNLQSDGTIVYLRVFRGPQATYSKEKLRKFIELDQAIDKGDILPYYLNVVHEDSSESLMAEVYAAALIQNVFQESELAQMVKDVSGLIDRARTAKYEFWRVFGILRRMKYIDGLMKNDST